jgi:hypothetical protein
MVEFTSMYVLCYRSTCTAHLQSDVAQIFCASMLVAYLGLSEKKIVSKMSRNVLPENAYSLRFHVLSFPWPSRVLFKPSSLHHFCILKNQLPIQRQIQIRRQTQIQHQIQIMCRQYIVLPF